MLMRAILLLMLPGFALAGIPVEIQAGLQMFGDWISAVVLALISYYVSAWSIKKLFLGALRGTGPRLR